MDWMYPRYLVSNIACGLDLSFEPWLYVAVFALIMICYFVINRVLVGRLKKMTPQRYLKIESKKMWWELKGCVRIEKIAMEISE